MDEPKTTSCVEFRDSYFASATVHSESLAGNALAQQYGWDKGTEFKGDGRAFIVAENQAKAHPDWYDRPVSALVAYPSWLFADVMPCPVMPILSAAEPAPAPVEALPPRRRRRVPGLIS